MGYVRLLRNSDSTHWVEGRTDMADEKVDTYNKFLVGSRGKMGLCIMLPPGCGLPIAYEDALNLAAWLVALTGEEERFKVVLEAVLGT